MRTPKEPTDEEKAVGVLMAIMFFVVMLMTPVGFHQIGWPWPFGVVAGLVGGIVLVSLLAWLVDRIDKAMKAKAVPPAILSTRADLGDVRRYPGAKTVGRLRYVYTLEDLSEDVYAVILPNGLTVDVSWFPQHDPDGYFHVRVFKDHWDDVLYGPTRVRSTIDLVPLLDGLVAEFSTWKGDRCNTAL